MTTEAQWRKKQDAYRALDERIDTLRRELRAKKYGFDGFYAAESYWSASDRRRIEVLRERRGRIGDQIIEFLYEHSPRHGVPLHWICTELTFEDAMTAGELSVTPPLAYGATPANMREFCRALKSA